ncbi:MAG: D-ribose ABC transporter substrate-binding protein, partial [Chloroflexus aggregans]
MKHLLRIIIVLGLSALAACTSTTPVATPTTPAQSSSNITIGLVISTLNNPFFVTLRDGAQRAADAAGVTLTIVDAQDDSAKMIAGIEDLITKKVNALIINPTDSDAVVPAIQKANEAG